MFMRLKVVLCRVGLVEEDVGFPGINGGLQEVGSKTASMLIPEATDALVWVMARSVISNAIR